MYFPGDTDLFPQMASLDDIDIALFPIGGWGPTVGEGHLDPERARAGDRARCSRGWWCRSTGVPTARFVCVAVRRTGCAIRCTGSMPPSTDLG